MFFTKNTLQQQKSIIRLELWDTSDSDIKSAINDVRNTVYKLWAKQSLAPEITDCVTVIRHIIRELTQESFPLTYIWDMPRNLIEWNFLSPKILPVKQNRTWDLLFFYWNSRFEVRMITHIWMCIDKWKYFHSLWKKDWSWWWTITPLSEKYWKIATRWELCESRDPRNKY